MPPRQCSKSKAQTAKSSKRICLPLSREDYAVMVADQQRFRAGLDKFIQQYPELFPAAIEQGYQLWGWRQQSVKLPEVKLRRICLKECDEQGMRQVYTVVPGYVLPYMTGYTDDVEKALFLRRFNVPFWALTYVFGRDDMYWQRLVAHCGRYDLVGTTVKAPASLPEHLLADEKHTRLNGERVYVATTVGQDCVLGISLALAADEASLTEAYGHFKQEAQRLQPGYTPATVNTDGWAATQQAWYRLFPTIVIIQCFLHAFLTIRARCKRLQDHFPEINRRVWDIYHAPHPTSFRQQVRALEHWARRALTGAALQSVLKLCDKAELFVLAFAHPHAHRTSNMIDRQLDPLDRCLDRAHYFHGHRLSAEYQLRAWALFHNFRPYCPRATLRETYQSPFHKLNGFVYHDNWLQNLLVAASLGGSRATNTIR